MPGVERWSADAPELQELLRATTAWRARPPAWALPLSSPYGPRVHPIEGERRWHHGIDLPLPEGWPVLSIWPGRVTRLDVAGLGAGVRNGNAVHVATGPWRVSYLHLSAHKVGEGETVRLGQPVGEAGSTGLSTGPHLHLQVYYRGRTIDPALLYPPAALEEP